jgi:hypothetical protein
VAVQVQGLIDATFERVAHDEVETVEGRKLVAFDVTSEKCAKPLLQVVRRQRPRDGTVVLGVIDEHTDVRAVALVSGARVRDVAKKHGAAHETRTSVRTSTSLRASEAE